MAAISGIRRSRIVNLDSDPIRRPPERLPWPRNAADDPSTPLGVDVKFKRPDIIKIVHKYFRVPEVPMDELLQEVFLAVIHKNFTKSAHDPRKSSFGHYIYMVANNVCINLVHRKRRYDKERNSLDSPCNTEDGHSILEIAEAAAPEITDDFFDDHLEDIEGVMRQNGMWDLARYVRAARSGASPDVIREALTWDNHKVSTKTVRDMRNQIKNWLAGMAVAR